MTNNEKKPIDENELTRRRRVVKGWAFMDLPKEEVDAIRAYLDGGPVPPGYETIDANMPPPNKNIHRRAKR